MSGSRSRGAQAGRQGSAALPLRAAGWLGLAAAPTFALMAVVTGVLGDGPMAMPCTVAPGIPIDGMLLMYALMSVFHLTPWLKLTFRSARG